MPNGLRRGALGALLTAAIAASAPAQTPAPTNPVAIQISPREIVLTWDTMPGVAEYRVYGLPSAGATTATKLLGRVPGTYPRFVAVVPVALAKVAQQYAVESADARGNVSVRVDFPAVTLATPTAVPPPPTGASAIATTTGDVQLSWTAAAGATAYEIMRAPYRQGFHMVCARCPGTSYVDRGVIPGESYEYSIAAANALGISTRVRTNPVTPGGKGVAGSGGGTPPPAPAQLAASVSGATTMDLTWQASFGATSYQLRRILFCGSTDFSRTVTLGATASAQQRYTDDLSAAVSSAACGGLTLAPRYAMSATNALGMSSPSTASGVLSTTVSGTSGSGTSGVGAGVASAPPPVGAPHAVIGTSSVSLSWRASPGATSYRIERAVGAGPWQLVSTLAGNVTAMLDNLAGAAKLNPKYRITAVNAAGSSVPVAFP